MYVKLSETSDAVQKLGGELQVGLHAGNKSETLTKEIC